MLILLKDDWQNDENPDDLDNANIEQAEHQNGNELRNTVQNFVLHYYGYE